MARKRSSIPDDLARGFVVRVRKKSDKTGKYGYRDVSRVYSIKTSATQFMDMYMNSEHIDQSDIWVTSARIRGD